MTPPPAIGEVFTVPHPFWRGSYTRHEQDGHGEDAEWTSETLDTWRPGTRQEHRDEQDDVCVADAMGAQVLTVVGVYKPGRFPVRVFYERVWVDPDGKTFGKRKCRATTVPAFRRLVAGYRVPFTLGDRALLPIATAPRDGSPVRLHGPKGLVVGCYHPERRVWLALPRRYAITPPPTQWLRGPG